MYQIIFYHDKNKYKPVKAYIDELSEQKNKNSRIKLKKIIDYIDILSKKGTSAGMPYMRRLEDEIWELRPLRDRIFFAAWTNNSFVLLHHFLKKTEKTPPNEIKKAKKEFYEFREEYYHGR